MRPLFEKVFIGTGIEPVMYVCIVFAWDEATFICFDIILKTAGKPGRIQADIFAIMVSHIFGQIYAQIYTNISGQIPLGELSDGRVCLSSTYTIF